MRDTGFEIDRVTCAEDVLLVAQQANVSVDRARAALEDAEGDLARAILMLSTG